MTLPLHRLLLSTVLGLGLLAPVACDDEIPPPTPTDCECPDPAGDPDLANGIGIMFGADVIAFPGSPWGGFVVCYIESATDTSLPLTAWFSWYAPVYEKLPIEGEAIRASDWGLSSRLPEDWN